MKLDGPSPYQKKVIWKAVTGLAILVIALLLITLIWATSSVLSYLQPVLLPVAIAGVVAYLLEPIVSWLIKKGMSRMKSVLSVFAAFILVIIGMGFIVIPPLVEQMTNDKLHKTVGEKVHNTFKSISKNSWLEPVFASLLAKHEDSTQDAPTFIIPSNATTPIPEAIRAVEPIDEQIEFSETNLANYLSKNAGKIAAITGKLITSSTSTFIGTLGLLIGLAMVPIYLYYFLKEGTAIKNNWHKYVPLKASKFKTEVIETLTEINGYLISFFRGQVLVAIIDGLLVGIALTIFQLPYGILIGLILGIIGVIPFIGNLLCLIPACFIAYVHFNFAKEVPGQEQIWLGSHQWLGDNPLTYVGAVAAIFIIVQQINSLVTAPKIVGESVGLHPMTVIFSMLFWSLILGGMLGALLAVPMTAAVKVLFRRYIWERQIQKFAGDEKLAFADESDDFDEDDDGDDDNSDTDNKNLKDSGLDDLEDGFLA